MGPLVTFDRREDWPERLNDLIDLRRATPFSWGIQDCVTFAAECVEAMTDARPIADLPAWHSREEAARAIAEACGEGRTGHDADLVRAIETRLGRGTVAALARRGDLVLVDVAGTRALGVCVGALVAAPGPRGLEWVGMGQWHMSWRIG